MTTIQLARHDFRSFKARKNIGSLALTAKTLGVDSTIVDQCVADDDKTGLALQIILKNYGRKAWAACL